LYGSDAQASVIDMLLLAVIAGASVSLIYSSTSLYNAKASISALEDRYIMDKLSSLFLSLGYNTDTTYTVCYRIGGEGRLSYIGNLAENIIGRDPLQRCISSSLLDLMGDNAVISLRYMLNNSTFEPTYAIEEELSKNIENVVSRAIGDIIGDEYYFYAYTLYKPRGDLSIYSLNGYTNFESIRGIERRRDPNELEEELKKRIYGTSKLYTFKTYITVPIDPKTKRSQIKEEIFIADIIYDKKDPLNYLLNLTKYGYNGDIREFYYKIGSEDECERISTKAELKIYVWKKR